MENYAANKTIISEGTDNTIFYIIADGSVTAAVSSHDILLKKGDIVGIFDITSPVPSCSYTAHEDCTLVPYSFHNARLSWRS